MSLTGPSPTSGTASIGGFTVKCNVAVLEDMSKEASRIDVNTGSVRSVVDRLAAISLFLSRGAAAGLENVEGFNDTYAKANLLHTLDTQFSKFVNFLYVMGNKLGHREFGTMTVPDLPARQASLLQSPMPLAPPPILNITDYLRTHLADLTQALDTFLADLDLNGDVRCPFDLEALEAREFTPEARRVADIIVRDPDGFRNWWRKVTEVLSQEPGWIQVAEEG